MSLDYSSNITSGVLVKHNRDCATSPAPRSLSIPPGDHSTPGPALGISLHEHNSAMLADGPGGSDCTGREKLTRLPRAVRIHCATTCVQASNRLNCHVKNNDVHRWQTKDGPIPVGINLSSFESHHDRLLVETCLKIVLYSWNSKNAGPKFEYVHNLCDSAFFVNFGGDNPGCYASAFFPGSHYKDWYIYVYKLGLTLSEGQEQLLAATAPADIATARIQALEQNLTKILAHELLHVMGVRHCEIDMDIEREAYVRFPPGLSDSDNQDPLMQPTLDQMDMHKLGWKWQTISEIRQIYSMEEGESIGRHQVRVVSWQEGAEKRKRLVQGLTDEVSRDSAGYAFLSLLIERTHQYCIAPFAGAMGWRTGRATRSGM